MGQTPNGHPEEGLEIPLERIPPELLQSMIRDFVTREWADQVDCGYTVEEKVSQVLQQLKARTAMVVFDCLTESWNIVPRKQ